MTAVRHPIFARIFTLAGPMMEREAAPCRTELLAGLAGRVLEIGGNGANFKHYPTTVNEVVALEPEAYLRRKAMVAALEATFTVSVRNDVAEPLALPDRSFDAAVVSLVLCSVPDPARALAELHRVLKPGGELRFFEHVRSPNARKARLQHRLDRSGFWPQLGGGCHCARDTLQAIKAAGFQVEHVRSLNLGPASMHTNPHIIGTAHVPIAAA